MSLGELRERFRAMHDARRVERAELGALFESARFVFRCAGFRRELAETAVAAALDALEAARDTEREWQSIVHGLALQWARAIDDSGETHPSEATHNILASYEWSDQRSDRRHLGLRGLSRRRLEKRAGLRLLRKSIPQGSPPRNTERVTRPSRKRPRG